MIEDSHFKKLLSRYDEILMSEDEFMKYRLKSHGYTGSIISDNIVDLYENLAFDKDDGTKLRRCKKHFRYEKGDNTVHVFYYEYYTCKIRDVRSVLGYTLLKPKENPSIKKRI